MKEKEHTKKNFPYSFAVSQLMAMVMPFFFFSLLFIIHQGIAFASTRHWWKRKLKINCQRRKNCIKRKDYYYYYYYYYYYFSSFRRNLIMPVFLDLLHVFLGELCTKYSAHKNISGTLCYGFYSLEMCIYIYHPIRNIKCLVLKWI